MSSAAHYIDLYKSGHMFQTPKGTSKVYSNLTGRISRLPGVRGLMSSHQQYFRDRWLVQEWNETFFQGKKDDVIGKYKRRLDNALGKGVVTMDHMSDLHDLGYLPIHLKAIPEGRLVPLRVPNTTITNTHPNFHWVPNYLETLLSDTVWHPQTTATQAFGYVKRATKYAIETGGDRSFAKFQIHDFSMRGQTSPESAKYSGMAHLFCSYGTDTLPAIDGLEEWYLADSDKEMIGVSIPATEHSVTCLFIAYIEKYLREVGRFEELTLDHLANGGTYRYREIRELAERAFIYHLITKVYPAGLVSVVSDTFDYFRVLTEDLPWLKPAIMAREGKLVMRPDSGDPVKIICGNPDALEGSPQHKGSIQILWELFGGKVNEKGYKELDPHIGLIYGDSITPERSEEIWSRLKAQGFASTNVVLGVGSYTYQYVTRDSLGTAMKATFGLINGVSTEVCKDPITDGGVKKSAKGLLRVDRVNGVLTLKEQCTPEEEAGGELQTIFKDGVTFNTTTLAEVRARVDEELEKELSGVTHFFD